MDIFLLLFGFLLAIFGIIGAFLPVLPGPLTSWLGLLLLHLTNVVPLNTSFLGITFAIALLIWIVDYFIPAMGAKKFGGTKYGAVGAMLGLLAGLIFLGPFGIIIGPFAGAFIGELLKDNKNTNKALKAAFGALIGFFASVFLKLTAAIVFTVLYVKIFWEYKSVFF